MSSCGRKEDIVWQHFQKSVTPGKKGCRAACRYCPKDMQGIPSRLKDHLKECKGVVNKPPPVMPLQHSDSTMPPAGIVANMKRAFEQEDDDGKSFPSVTFQPPSKNMKSSASVSSYFVATTAKERKAFDLQIATMIYATNSPARLAEHPEFKKLVTMLHPGYTPPSRIAVGDILLNEVYDEKFTVCKEKVKGKSVSMELDGWSNIHKEPVVCCSITTYEGDTFLTSTIDTQDEKHTGDNIEAIAEAAIKRVEDELGCKVKSFVTDNAANMKKCRSQLEDSHPVITYPCSAHVADRLAKDVDTSDVKSHIVQIAKYFKSHHLPNAWYKQEGGKALSLPIAIRWNSVNDCMQAYVDNWAILVKVVESHPEEIDSEIREKILDITLKRQATEYLSKMKPIAVALDRLQADKCHLSDAVVIWKELAESFDDIEMSLSDSKKLVSRMKIALTPAHFLAYLLDPRYNGSPHLSSEEIDTAMNYLADHHYAALQAVINYRAKASPFGSYMFKPEVLSGTDPFAWWQSQASMLDEHILSLVEQLFTARASTAGIERIFSTFGLVHSKLRNRLQTEKAGKLVFLYKLLNM